MIIGSGLLAKAFYKYSNDNNILIFASGVSDSTTISKSQFDREYNLAKDILEKYQDKTFIYFSSCDVENKDVNQLPYYKHKINVEMLLQEYANNYYIFRLPQVFGLGGNRSNLINYLFEKIDNNSSFFLIKGMYKNILHISDVYAICKYIIDNRLYTNSIVNVINEKYYLIDDIVKSIEVILSKKAIYNIKSTNSLIKYTTLLTKKDLLQAGVIFDDSYIMDKLLLYYQKRSQSNDK